ncbi:hypothetical protein TELCIR_00410 [Teladorsagia circumcincta]|uniref:Uncharacterized protein n=1 Tax=Teladorsagia circumcincta TaxID=45464 RepID=A0A2G9V666_TELCI|nr:hypothetical protein TELCIR_00410 [Teladorsagia circumcincta]
MGAIAMIQFRIMPHDENNNDTAASNTKMTELVVNMGPTSFMCILYVVLAISYILVGSGRGLALIGGYLSSPITVRQCFFEKYSQGKFGGDSRLGVMLIITGSSIILVGSESIVMIFIRWNVMSFSDIAVALTYAMPGGKLGKHCTCERSYEWCGLLAGHVVPARVKREARHVLGVAQSLPEIHQALHFCSVVLVVGLVVKADR